MSFQFHKDRQLYFEHQYLNSKNYILPFIEEKVPVVSGMKILEVGCGEGGVLKPFIEKGCHCTGIELETLRIDLAYQFMNDEIKSEKITFINKNIYDIEYKRDFVDMFNIIILKDVIEHIPDQQKLIIHLKKFLSPGGFIFFGFPPWYMAFGGHQQLCTNRVLSKLPYFHLFPGFIYKVILKIGGESDQRINSLMDIKKLGISTSRFERIVKNAGLIVLNNRFYLINPIYQYKFNIKPRIQFSLIEKIPYIRDFITTGVYYLVTDVMRNNTNFTS